MDHWLAIAAMGAGIGFVSGAFGKGGATLATPLLHAVGVPPLVAIASPLPATIPSTMAASRPYWQADMVDRRVVLWSIAAGTPAVAAGALSTRWIGGRPLIAATDATIALLGLWFLLRPHADHDVAGSEPNAYRLRMMAVAVAVGFASGLLANSGGFLLAPLYIAVLRVPIKTAFACSLTVAMALAVPGTVVHLALGHIDWMLVAVFGAASVPLSALGARVGLATEARHLERVYGAALAVLGTVFLVTS
jgi:hypothetical protein